MADRGLTQVAMLLGLPEDKVACIRCAPAAALDAG